MKGRRESNINVWFPFMHSQKWKYYFRNRIIMFCLPVPIVSVRNLYIKDRSAYSAAGNMWNNPVEYINRENWIWDWGRAIPRKGIHKWDFPCSARKFRPIVYTSNGHFLTPCLYCTVRWWRWWCRRPHGVRWRAGPPWAASAPYRTAAPRSAALFAAAWSACLTDSVPGLGSQVLKWKKHSCRTGTAGTVTFCLRGTGTVINYGFG